MDEVKPDWAKKCSCGSTVARYRGQGDVTCPSCGATYNAFGQRLRDDYASNPSTWDDEISDLDGIELQQARLEAQG